jgi:hypothetical protein
LGSLPWSSSTPCRKSWSCHEGPAPSWYLKEIAMAELQRLHHGCRSFCNPCILYANMCRELLDFTLATSPDISISRSWKQDKPFYASEVLNSLKPMAAMVFRESFPLASRNAPCLQTNRTPKWSTRTESQPCGSWQGPSQPSPANIQVDRLWGKTAKQLSGYPM